MLFIAHQEYGGTSSMRINLKFYGVFKTAAGSDAISLDVPLKEPTVRSALTQFLSDPNRSQLRQLIMEGESPDPRSTTLILVSGREIAALAGLDTKLTEEDELSLLPIAHGG